MRRWTLSFFLLLMAGTSGTAWGQFAQYTQPGDLITGLPVDRAGFEKASSEARFKLGPLRLAPWAGVRDVAYVDNAFGSSTTETESDVTATVGAGLRGYLRTGPKVFWTAHALPEYVWWKDLDGRSRLDGRYGFGVFAFFNRLDVELSLRRNEFQGVATQELLDRIHQRQDQARFALEIDLSQRFSFFTSVEERQLRFGLTSEERDRLPSFPLLDRDEMALQGGLRAKLGERWTVGLGYEETEANFIDPALDRSSIGTGPLLELRFAGEAVSFSTNLAFRSLEATEGSLFVDDESVTGQASVNWDRDGRLSLRLYGRRLLGFAITAGYGSFETQAIGVSTDLKVGGRSTLRGFVEQGTSDYSLLAGSTALPRSDDLSAQGLSFDFELRGNSSLRIGVTRTEVDSNLPGLDREVLAFSTHITFGGGGTSWY